MPSDSMTNTSKHAGGRRKGTTVSREAILRAAIELFAERGYEGATLRAITARAGVDVALVSHFFGGKQGLFEEAVLQRGDANLKLLAQLDPGDEPAPQLLRVYFSMWEDPATARIVRALFRAALESEESRKRLQELISRRLAEGIRAISPRNGEAVPGGRTVPQDPEEVTLRTQLIAAQLLGVGIARYIMQLTPLADVPREELINCLAPVIDAHLRGAVPCSSPTEEPAASAER